MDFDDSARYSWIKPNVKAVVTEASRRNVGEIVTCASIPHFQAGRDSYTGKTCSHIMVLIEPISPTFTYGPAWNPGDRVGIRPMGLKPLDDPYPEDKGEVISTSTGDVRRVEV